MKVITKIRNKKYEKQIIINFCFNMKKIYDMIYSIYINMFITILYFYFYAYYNIHNDPNAYIRYEMYINILL